MSRFGNISQSRAALRSLVAALAGRLGLMAGLVILAFFVVFFFVFLFFVLFFFCLLASIMFRDAILLFIFLVNT